MRAADLVIAAFADRQHAAVSTAQLRRAGVTQNAIAHRVTNARFTPLHRGVYRVGPIHTRLTTLMAAVLACGEGAALSHHAAAELHGFAPERPGPIDVVAPRQVRGRDGIRAHRGNVEVVEVSGIPATTPERTLLDLAARMTRRELDRAIEQALLRRDARHRSLTRAVDEHPNHRGRRALGAALEEAREPQITRSEAERVFLDLIDAARLPRPEMNVKVAGYEVDALWHDVGLVVEIDGYAFHGGRAAFERDRRKDADLTAAGLRVMRVTWRQITREREAVAARISAARAPGRRLASGAPPGSRPGPPRW